MKTVLATLQAVLAAIASSLGDNPAFQIAQELITIALGLANAPNLNAQRDLNAATLLTAADAGSVTAAQTIYNYANKIGVVQPAEMIADCVKNWASLAAAGWKVSQNVVSPPPAPAPEPAATAKT